MTVNTVNYSYISFNSHFRGQTLWKAIKPNGIVKKLNRDTYWDKREFFPTLLSTIILSHSLFFSHSFSISLICFTHRRPSERAKLFEFDDVKIKRKVYSLYYNSKILLFLSAAMHEGYSNVYRYTYRYLYRYYYR